MIASSGASAPIPATWQVRLLCWSFKGAGAMRIVFRPGVARGIEQQAREQGCGDPVWNAFLRSIGQGPTVVCDGPGASPPKPREARPKLPRAPFFERLKGNVRDFLRDALTPLDPAISAEEISVTFSVSMIGDNVVLPAQLRRVEVLELFFYLTGGSQTLSVKVGGITLYPAQVYPDKSYLSTPPFEVSEGVAVILNLSAATAVVGRVRYAIEEPFRHVGGQP